MNDIIRSACPDCGEVDMAPDAVTLMVSTVADLSYYAFNCPGCDDRIKKPADAHVISLLLSGGVRAQIWQVPAEAAEPKNGPALTYDDLLDFALDLTADPRLAARLAAAP